MVLPRKGADSSTSDIRGRVEAWEEDDGIAQQSDTLFSGSSAPSARLGVACSKETCALQSGQYGDALNAACKQAAQNVLPQHDSNIGECSVSRQIGQDRASVVLESTMGRKWLRSREPMIMVYGHVASLASRSRT